MSSAGTIFREQIFRSGGTGPGSQTIDVIIENDGAVFTLQRLSGTATVLVSISCKFPDPMTYVTHQELQLNSNTIVQTSHITSKRVQLEVSWADTCSVGIAVRSVSGSVIAALNNISQTDLDKVVVVNQQLVRAVEKLHEQQEIMINHLRQVTEINDDTGELF